MLHPTKCVWASNTPTAVTAHLSSESIGRNGREVLERLQFAGGKTLTDDFHIVLLRVRKFDQRVYIRKRPIYHTHPLVTYPNASPIVLNLKELQSAVFYRHLDAAGLCIQTVIFEIRL